MSSIAKLRFLLFADDKRGWCRSAARCWSLGLATQHTKRKHQPQPTTMDLSLSSRSLLPALSPSRRLSSEIAVTGFLEPRPYLFPPRKTNRHVSASVRERLPPVASKEKSRLDGVSEELNGVASQDMDMAPARRRVRAAFTEVHQQLDHYLFKMAPAGIRTEEWYERSARGLQIFSKSWLPPPHVRIKAALYFCHGYGDTCTFFLDGIARQIAASGYGIYALDYPGFGLSDGLHGHIQSFDELVDDVIEHYTKIKERPELRGLPHFIFGQSMGGAVTLKAHLKRPVEWDGVILVAPMCKISEDVKPSPPVLNFFKLLSIVMPKAKIFPTKDLSELSFRDPRKRGVAAYNVIGYSDQTRLKTVVELLKATSDIESQVEKVSSPLLILHGAADRVTDPLVSQFLYEKAASSDKTLKLYEEGYHSILEGEPDDRIIAVLADIIAWLDARC